MARRRGLRFRTPKDILAALAGMDLSYYFPPPLYQVCAGLVSDPTMHIDIQNTSESMYSQVSHASGKNAPTQPTALDNQD